MSGLCSKHAGHDPTCQLCLAIPLTDREKAYYEGWDARLESIHRNGWVVSEAIVQDAYEALEKAARDLVAGGPSTALEVALAEPIWALDNLRKLKRGFRC